MAEIGHGTTLGVDDGSTGYNLIGRITQLSGPSLSTDLVETTAMDSTNAFKEYIKGLKDWGEVTFTVNSKPAASGDTVNYYDELLTEASASAAKEWQITFPNTGATLTFDALTTGFNINANPGEVITTDVTLKVTGDITWA